MATRNFTATALGPRTPGVVHFLFHVMDGGSSDPGALVSECVFKDSLGFEYREFFKLETADRDGSGNLLGTYTPINNAGGMTTAQITTLRGLLGSNLYGAAVTAAGFV